MASRSSAPRTGPRSGTARPRARSRCRACASRPRTAPAPGAGQRRGSPSAPRSRAGRAAGVPPSRRTPAPRRRSRRCAPARRTAASGYDSPSSSRGRRCRIRRCYERPRRRRSAGVSTSANVSAARPHPTAPRSSSPARRPPTARNERSPASQRGLRAVERVGSVARARVLQAAVDDRDHRRGSGPVGEQAQDRQRRRTAGRTRAARPGRAPGTRRRDARAPATSAASGPEPGGSSRTHGRPARAGADLDHGIAHLGEHARRAHRERLALPDDARLVAPMRRLAPPVSSTPAQVTAAAVGGAVSLSGRSE